MQRIFPGSGTGGPRRPSPSGPPPPPPPTASRPRAPPPRSRRARRPAARARTRRRRPPAGRPARRPLASGPRADSSPAALEEGAADRRDVVAEFAEPGQEDQDRAGEREFLHDLPLLRGAHAVVGLLPEAVREQAGG